MLFVVDVGNSHTVTGLYKNNQLIGQWRLKSDKDRTVDEIAIRYFTLFKLAEIDADEISHVIISSVVPILEAAWVACFKTLLCKKLKSEPFIVNDRSVKNMISIEIDHPAEVGADRLVNGIAAWEAYKENLIVIDFGTAITFDCVTADCRYLGGTILPGVSLSLEALSSKTAKLPHIDISTPPATQIGKNTIDAMKSGIINGYGAMIDGLIVRLRDEMCSTDKEKDSFKVVATGGVSSIICKQASLVDKIDPLLTLRGLKIIHDAQYA